MDHKVWIFDPETKKYNGEYELSLDPLETEKAGHPIYAEVPYGVRVKPLEEKEGFDIYWNEDEKNWEYREKKKEPEEPKPYEPTELDKAYEGLYEYQNKLAQTDYINSKIGDAVNTGDEALADELRKKYSDVFIEREEWREKVRYYESEIERLKLEESTNKDS